jgi:hypothetical protein
MRIFVNLILAILNIVIFGLIQSVHAADISPFNKPPIYNASPFITTIKNSIEPSLRNFDNHKRSDISVDSFKFSAFTEEIAPSQIIVA